MVVSMDRKIKYLHFGVEYIEWHRAEQERHNSFHYLPGSRTGAFIFSFGSAVLQQQRSTGTPDICVDERGAELLRLALVSLF